MTNRLAVASLQTEIDPDNEARTLKSAASLIGRAARKGARVVLLPEHWLAGKVVEPRNDVYRMLGGIAAELDLYINTGGVFEKEAGKTHFVATVIAPNGEVVSKQRKVHLFGRERQIALPGDRLDVYKIDGVTAGTLVCHDFVFPECARALALKGAEVLFIPSLVTAAGKEPWHLYIKARALENRVPVVSSNARTPPRFPGESLIIDLAYDKKEGVMNLDVMTAKTRTILNASLELSKNTAPRAERLGEIRPGVDLREELRA